VRERERKSLIFFNFPDRREEIKTPAEGRTSEMIATFEGK
jgi:hypothetical protein